MQNLPFLSFSLAIIFTRRVQRMSRQRGILGLKKDPKRQMLFTFNVREGDEWPSSDSEDSDYSPETSDKRASFPDSSSEDDK